MKSKYIIFLNSGSCLRPSKVGSKAFRLAEMSTTQCPIPPGFVITVEAFKDFCLYNNLQYLNKKGSFKDVAEAIKQSDFSQDIRADIEKSLHELPYVEFAVRSSSIAEDGMDYSMAGQFDTFLCTPRESVLNKIKECWASMFNEAVIAYAKKNSLPLSYEMGVIVQKQINPLFSGVLFTIDPMTKSTDYLIIEWIKGLGDKLVSGEVTPERIYINRFAPVIPNTKQRNYQSH